MTRPARMRDVAELAGVGTMTVSRVINGNLHVTEETRRRVFEAIEKLGYRPNQIARSLREQRSRQIGIIVPNLHDPFFAFCAQAVSLVAKEHGYSVNIAMSYEDPEVEFNEAMIMLSRHTEGLVVIPSAGKITQLANLEFQTIPIVTLDRPLGRNRFDSVVVENEDGAHLAVGHLIAHGHRRISFLGLSPDLYTIGARFLGYRKAMQEAGLPLDVRWGNASQREMLEALRELLSSDAAPSALFCGNNLTTRHALHGLAELNVNVPKSVALIGFDDFETADLLRPAVTVVRQPTTDMGRIGAGLLFSRLRAEGRQVACKQITLPVELIIRGSCGTHRPSADFCVAIRDASDHP